MARFLEMAENRIATVVDRFLSLVRRDRLIGPLFNRSNQDWDERAITSSSSASGTCATCSFCIWNITTGREHTSP
jgi:hypothetical protein